jgi:hypothetical protein
VLKRTRDDLARAGIPYRSTPAAYPAVSARVCPRIETVRSVNFRSERAELTAYMHPVAAEEAALPCLRGEELWVNRRLTRKPRTAKKEEEAHGERRAQGARGVGGGPRTW